MNGLAKRGFVGFDRLDAGGQGNVYRTTKEGKLFAIKVVPLTIEDGQTKVDEDLRRELYIAKNLHHPNCVTVSDMFHTTSRVYIVMDFMPNGNVANVVRQGGPLCEWNIKTWFPPIVRAVKYLHENAIAHRDLKLDNVLLDAHLNPVLTDFGFSRFVNVDQTGEIKVSKTYCGTRSHQPPEILKHVPYNPFKCDIWCLGVALFIMTNQIYPFDKKQPKEVMYSRQMARDYRLQPSVEEKISTELKSMIRMLLEPEPAERPTVDQVCTHEWFPVVYQEHQWKVEANVNK